MISYLHIRNLALVSDLEIEFAPGLNTITGETGAGKSLLLDAVQLLIGARAGAAIIRKGEVQCEVTAIFQVRFLPTGLARHIEDLLREADAAACDDGELVIRRVITSTGSRAYVNGSSVTASLLKELGDLLVDIHGPHDHQSLLQPGRQLEILDAYANLTDQAARCAALYHDVVSTQGKLREAEGKSLSMEDMEIIRHQLQEIRQAAPDIEEESHLVSRYRTCCNARQLIDTASACSQGLNRTDGCVTDVLAEFVRRLRDIEEGDAQQGKVFMDRLEGIIEALGELGEDLQAYAESFDLDGSELQELEDRLDLIQKLKRRHGGSVATILEEADRMQAELDAYDDHEREVAALQSEEKRLAEEYRECCRTLTGARMDASSSLAEAIAGKLRRLGFERAEFRVEVTAAEAGPKGDSRVEFCFAPNPGEDMHPLRQIASSGEMARVMLAVKTVLTEADSVPVLIFDEVDANIGGRTAATVAQELLAIGRKHQVISVTHLPQIAAAGCMHLHVSKQVTDGRTQTTLSVLTGSDREYELVRMLGADAGSAAALNHARELLATVSDSPCLPEKESQELPKG